MDKEKKKKILGQTYFQGEKIKREFHMLLLHLKLFHSEYFL